LGIGLKAGLGLEEGKMWPTPLVDNLTSREYFFLIGIPRVGSKEMGKVRERLRDWLKGFGGREGKGRWQVEGRVVSRKVVSECGFEVFVPGKYGGEGAEIELKGEAGAEVDGNREGEEKGSRKGRKEKKGEFPAAGGFKKVKGSNPAEVRRQFLEHSMGASASSSSPSTNTASPVKLRPGKEVLNRMKFDENYEIGEFVVGYIDRKEGILEASVGEWEGFGREDLMAYVKNTKSGEIVWDKARKADLVFGENRGG
jgi:uncharacterized protein (UPF0248 family)